MFAACAKIATDGGFIIKYIHLYWLDDNDDGGGESMKRWATMQAMTKSVTHRMTKSPTIMRIARPNRHMPLPSVARTNRRTPLPSVARSNRRTPWPASSLGLRTEANRKMASSGKSTVRGHTSAGLTIRMTGLGLVTRSTYQVHITSSFGTLETSWSCEAASRQVAAGGSASLALRFLLLLALRQTSTPLASAPISNCDPGAAPLAPGHLGI